MRICRTWRFRWRFRTFINIINLIVYLVKYKNKITKLKRFHSIVRVLENNYLPHGSLFSPWPDHDF
jgi:hypothetical protein